MDANSNGKQYDVVISFNPRARDGREDAFLGVMPSYIVSIHAPVMDANSI